MAWGDRILPDLRPAVKVYVASGRFVSVGPEGAVYAVPDQGLMSRARPGVPEVERALEAHFGRRVPFILVLDEGAPPAPPADFRPPAGDPTGEGEDPQDYVLADLEDAPAAVVSVHQRLLEAFPGAEEEAP